ncbi:MAG: NADH-quinone oxidoreductase subunit J [Firmicutes bacterium]|nr:NADH-quinone oxidoreductase subunit J [Bacillota bacterium]MCL5039020.1 NADH-quinone oxidoreductase subunit J [Bacillota bacterium]
MNLQLLAFMILSLVTLGAAFKVITARFITHAALYLALSFVGVAGLFLLLNADFLAAVQLLVYVGAITTMLIFAVMLSQVEEIRQGAAEEGFWRRILSARFGVIPLAVAAALAGVILYLYRFANWKAVPVAPDPNTTRSIGQAMFTTYLIPFEVASLVLLVAMIGAIVLTMKKEDRSR